MVEFGVESLVAPRNPFLGGRSGGMIGQVVHLLVFEVVQAGDGIERIAQEQYGTGDVGDGGWETILVAEGWVVRLDGHGGILGGQTVVIVVIRSHDASEGTDGLPRQLGTASRIRGYYRRANLPRLGGSNIAGHVVS